MNNDTSDQDADPVVRYSKLRNVTDYTIAPSLVVATFGSWVFWGLYLTELIFKPISNASNVSQSFSLAIISLPAFIVTVPVGYVVYSIVNRRNMHLGRSEALLWASIGRLKNNTSSTDTSRLFAANTAERDLQTAAVEEKERSAYLWSLLSLIPFIGGVFLAYALFRVNNDFQRHEKREFVTIEDLQRGLGLPVGSVPVQAKYWYPSRNTVAYFVAGILGPLFSSLTVLRFPPSVASFPVTYLLYLTLGWAWIYWLYVSARDPEAHFVVQSHLESELQPILTGLQKGGRPTSIGGAM
jgi:hypothetical protein